MNSFLLFQSIHLCLAVATKGERKVRMEIINKIKKKKEGNNSLPLFYPENMYALSSFSNLYLLFFSDQSNAVEIFLGMGSSEKTDLYIFLRKMFVVFAYGCFVYYARAFWKENVLLENGFCDKRRLKEKFFGVSFEIKNLEFEEREFFKKKKLLRLYFDINSKAFIYFYLNYIPLFYLETSIYTLCTTDGTYHVYLSSYLPLTLNVLFL